MSLIPLLASDIVQRLVLLQVHPIAAVEIEVSLSSYEQETKDVIAAAKELGVVVIAYSCVFPRSNLRRATR